MMLYGALVDSRLGAIAMDTDENHSMQLVMYYSSYLVMYTDG